jgi:structural maintenance of chromosome 3 (chondroitin sulfate proteoglycan 6)
LSKQLQETRTALERLQTQQAEDNKAFSKQQKSDEKYHTRKTLLTDRKGDVDRNIRDLGVLPEEAFQKYIDGNLDKVLDSLESTLQSLTIIRYSWSKSCKKLTTASRSSRTLTRRLSSSTTTSRNSEINSSNAEKTSTHLRSRFRSSSRF